MSLATDPAVVRCCRAFARRWGRSDPDDAAAEGLLAVVTLEARRPDVPRGRAVHEARWRILRRCGLRLRDDARARDHAEAMAGRSRPVHDRAELLDVPALMAMLTPHQREAVRLRIWEGLSPAESAARLGCTPNTVSQHYRHALAKLRSFYGHQD